jgi:hypothetical protein
MSSVSVEIISKQLEVLPDTDKRKVVDFIDYLLYKRSIKKTKKKKKENSFDPRKFRGTAKLNLTPEEIDRECAKLRDEWERTI